MHTELNAFKAYNEDTRMMWINIVNLLLLFMAWNMYLPVGQ